MMRKFWYYITALTCLGAFALLYHTFADVWLQPPHVEPIASAPNAKLRGAESLGDLFAADSWQRGPCKRLQTRGGMLLFEKWEQTSADQWKLWPITIIIGRGTDRDQRESPIVVQSEQGAEIKFSGSLDVMSGGAPPIQRGRMIGSVEISRSNVDDPAEALLVRTGNVGIDNRKIWTTETIEMQLGEARLVGRDLTIHLATSASDPMMKSGQDALLDRMELIYLDQFELPLKKGFWEATTVSVASPVPLLNATAPTVASGAATVKLECQGRMEYDFAINQLSLRESVTLIHQIQGAKEDRFECDSIDLTLKDPRNKSIRRDTAVDWISRIRATGSPLIADLPNLDFSLAAGQIDLQAANGLMRADGNKGIEVNYGEISARLESLVYQYDPSSPKTLGVIDARGVGIVRLRDSDAPLTRLQWSEGLKVQPLGPITTDEVKNSIGFWIDGEVQGLLADGGSVRAGSIEGVLKPNPKQSEEDDAFAMLPDWLSAINDVTLDTPSLSAVTQQLRLFFVSPSGPPDGMIENTKDEAKSSIRQVVVQPPSDTPQDVPVARSRPTIRGNAIVAKLEISDSGVTARDLSVEGAVHLTHTLQLGGQPMPATMTGEQLRLIDGGGDDVLQLGSGVEAPARFEIGDGYFVGPMIQIRPSDNVVWINESGEFQIPSQAMPENFSIASSGNTTESSIRWTRAPRCRWHGEMVFDGRTATFTDGVEIDAAFVSNHEPWELKIDGDRMSFLLTEGVQVRDLKTVRNAAVQRIELTQSSDRPLMIHAVQYAADGLIESKHLLSTQKLTLTPAGGGQLLGQGPGWYRCWTRGDSMAMNLSSQSNSSDSDSLSGVHLVFEEKLSGDLANRSLEFVRGIRVGVQSIDSFERTFDAQTMDALSSGQTTVDCDRLTFAIAGNRGGTDYSSSIKSSWESLVDGGVVFRSRNDKQGLLECTASRAAYSASKDSFSIQGVPNRPALFRQIRPDGTPGAEGAARNMTVRLSTMEVIHFELEHLNMAVSPDATSR